MRAVGIAHARITALILLLCVSGGKRHELLVDDQLENRLQAELVCGLGLWVSPRACRTAKKDS